jgi:diguanylate cyclase (GGDEF)-like protein
MSVGSAPGATYSRLVTDVVGQPTDWTLQRHVWAVRMRWAAAAFGISEFLLNDPPALWRPAVVLATVALLAYNTVAYALIVRGRRPLLWLRAALVCADFVVCAIWVLLLSNHAGPLTCMILALACVEAALLYGTAGIAFAIPSAMALLILVASLQAFLFGEKLNYNDWVYAALLISGVSGIVAAMVREMERQHAIAMTLARIDPLTGIANRRAFFAAFDAEINRAQRTGAPLSVAILDLDHFKRVNDRAGHRAGDAVLESLGGLLRSSLLRQGIDVPARLGGEEFGLILPGADLNGAAAVAERLRRAFHVAPHTRLGTLSGGVATLGPQYETPDDLLQAADQALYAAKEAGRDRIRRAPEDQETTRRPPAPGGLAANLAV